MTKGWRLMASADGIKSALDKGFSICYWSNQQTAGPIFMLKAIRKTRIYEEVVSQIHELIREGKFKAGDQLPSERELAETFKVSRTSVREALRALETQGLIVSRTGMGNFIAALPVESLVAPLVKLLIEEKTALADIFEMRKLIEPHIAALAAEREAMWGSMSFLISKMSAR